ncbi:MAG TPA: DNA polymerase III subunit delta' C-terminal domain-containing protein, partial [Bacilli bacterium]|nr:DNA polymerase III subunit delta' C-terminal domain-containing protein [Bacilli bacterium]
DPDFLETYDLAKKIIKNLLLGNESPIITINLLGKKFLKLEDRKYHQYFLDMLVYFYNDILMYQLGNIEDIVYFDLLNNIDGEIEMEYEKIIANIELLLEAKNKLNFNINIDLMFFDLFLEMEKING